MEEALNFHPIKIYDKSVFEKYFKDKELRSCDYAFANLCAWQSYYRSEYAEYNGFLIIRFFTNNHRAYMFPIGEEDPSDALDTMEIDARRNGHTLLLVGLNKSQSEICRKKYAHRIKQVETREYFDYIYERTNLATLQGKKYQQKRNHINRFIKQYKYEYRELKPSDIPDAIKLYSIWMKDKDETSESVIAEKKAIRFVFDNYDILDIHGGALWVDGEMVAFTYGSAVCNDTFVVHIEKANRLFDGAYAVINQLFVQHIPEKYKYINREDDLGDEGLRTAKLSYHPTFLQEKINLYLTHSNDAPKVDQLKKLWRDSFHDDEDFVDLFFEQMAAMDWIESSNIGGDLISALHLLPIKFQWNGDSMAGRYLYAAATCEEHRNNGLMSELIRKSLFRLYDQNEMFILLLPETQSLIQYYMRFGFACIFKGKRDGIILSDPIRQTTTKDINLSVCAIYDIERRCDGFLHVPEMLNVILTDYFKKRKWLSLFSNSDGWCGFEMDSYSSSGMMRIVRVYDFLCFFAKSHPDFSSILKVTDAIIPNNNATFKIDKGECMQITEKENVKTYSIDDVTVKLFDELKKEKSPISYWGWLND